MNDKQVEKQEQSFRKKLLDLYGEKNSIFSVRNFLDLYGENAFRSSRFQTILFFLYTYVFVSSLNVILLAGLNFNAIFYNDLPQGYNTAISKAFNETLNGANTQEYITHSLSISLFTSVVLNGLMFLRFLAKRKDKETQEYNVEVEKLETKVSETPDKAQPAWELARKNLEHYLDRNLQQIKDIYYLTAGISLIGFIIIAAGIWIGFNHPAHSNLSFITTGSGILVELISATFLFIYRSAMVQAESHVRILERINIVGMSVHILDGIGESSVELKDKTRADMASSLLLAYSSEVLNDKISNQKQEETKSKKI